MYVWIPVRFKVAPAGIVVRLNDYILYVNLHKCTKLSKWDLLVKGNREIRFETSTINGVHVVGGAFINASIHLRCRIDFDLWFDPIIADAPLMNLNEAICKVNRLDVRAWLNLHACTNVEIFLLRLSAKWFAAGDFWKKKIGSFSASSSSSVLEKW